MKRRIYLLSLVMASAMALNACGGAKDCDCPSFSSVETPTSPSAVERV